MVRNGQGVECLSETAQMTQRRVFAYDGVGYTREVGAPAPRPFAAREAAPVKAERFPVLALVAVGFAIGTAVAALGIVAGLF